MTAAILTAAVALLAVAVVAESLAWSRDRRRLREMRDRAALDLAQRRAEQENTAALHLQSVRDAEELGRLREGLAK